MNQTLRAFKEASEHNGPSVIIAYSTCISHGISGGMKKKPCVLKYHDVGPEKDHALEDFQRRRTIKPEEHCAPKSRRQDEKVQDSLHSLENESVHGVDGSAASFFRRLAESVRKSETGESTCGDRF